jgi:hypothetical protein
VSDEEEDTHVSDEEEDTCIKPDQAYIYNITYTRGQAYIYNITYTCTKPDQDDLTHMYPPPHLTHMYPPPHLTHVYPPPHLTHMYPPPHLTHICHSRLTTDQDDLGLPAAPLRDENGGWPARGIFFISILLFKDANGGYARGNFPS